MPACQKPGIRYQSHLERIPKARIVPGAERNLRGLKRAEQVTENGWPLVIARLRGSTPCWGVGVRFAFEQSFSEDGGKAWEVNWIADQKS